METKIVKVGGMTCNACEKKVKKIIESQVGLKVINLDIQSGKVVIEGNDIDLSSLGVLLDKEGYFLEENTGWVYRIIFVLWIALILFLGSKAYAMLGSSKLDTSIGFAGVFVFGVITSFHCIGMCGGIAISRANSDSKFKNLVNSLYYNLGRVLTYALIGGVLGTIGGAFTLSLKVKGIMYLVIAIVMMSIGGYNAGILKKRIKLPTIKLRNRNISLNRPHSFLVGIMNGFMPCGPLQTMQLFVLTTLSFKMGFLYMLVFGLGTSIMMIVFGNIGSAVPKKYSKQIVKTSGVIVLIMAVGILNQGLSGLGVKTPFNFDAQIGFENSEDSGDESAVKQYAEVIDGYQIVVMNVNGYYDLENVIVRKDMPVKIKLEVTKVTPCIDTVTIPEYDIVKGLSIGSDEMIFTPNKSGEVVITCWMNMVTQYLEVE